MTNSSPIKCWLILLAALTLLQGCASLPQPAQRAQTYAISADKGTDLADLPALSVPAGSPSAFRPLPLSAWSTEARLTLPRHAKQSLDLQYYLLQNDMTGHTLLRAVRDAAQRGVRVRVRVRILIDDLHTALSDRMLLALGAYQPPPSDL